MENYQKHAIFSIPYPNTYCIIVSAIIAFHNFVRLNDRDDRGFNGANQDSIPTRQHVEIA